jgi:hypothetical protein
MVPDIQQPVMVPQTQQPAVDPAQFATPQQAVPAPQSAGQPAGSPVLGTYDTQQRATTAIANAAAQKSTLDEMAQADMEDKLVASELRQQKIAQQFTETFNSRMADLDDISKQLNSQEFTNAKIDNNRLWNDASTGQKILAGLSIALGGYGGALSGKGDNKALDIINKAIDRDIESQKFNIQQKTANLKDRANMTSNMLSTLRQKYGDDLQAESALRAIQIQQTQLKLQQFASRTESKTVQENAKYVNAGLEREKQVALQSLKAQSALQAKISNLSAGETLSAAEEAMLPKEMREAYISQRERTVNGFIGQTKDKESASEMQKVVASSQPAIDAVRQLQEFTKNGMNWSPEKRAQAATQLQLVVGKLREPLLGPGTMQQEEYKRLLSAVGNPDELMSYGKAQRARLNLVLKNLESDLETKAKAYGLRSAPRSSVPMRPYGQ